MTEQEYLEISAACDTLLRAPGSTLARLAIPMLHVINEHPGSLAQYEPLLTGRWARTNSDRPRALLRACRGMARAMRGPRRVPPFSTTLDVVIVSHLSNPAQLRDERDFYFASLQRLLLDRGIGSLLVLIDHLPQPASAPPDLSFALPRTVLPRAVQPAQEMRVWQSCLAASRQLGFLSDSLRSPLERRIALFASRAALSASAVANLRMHQSLSDLFQQVNPRIVVTTYEGDAAERLIWHAARAAQRRPLCVGYQHARLLRRAHAIRRRIGITGIDCDPDVVLTSGEIPHQSLAASPELSSTRLIRYGSHRCFEQPAKGPSRNGSRRCVVLPDADEREQVTLFEFALACARQRPELTFRLRPHPIVDAQALANRYPVLRRLPPNVSLSTGIPLAHELEQASHCLYRGSSAVIQAVVAGLKPLYLARPGELPFDPLFELTEWRETVQSPDELAARMNECQHSQQDLAAADRARAVCERYVSPLRNAAIDELVALAPP